MILARLLTPEDFGLIAMVNGLVGFVAMFKDSGLSMATVQRAEINHAQVSNLFWINVGISVILTGIVAAMAPFIAWFYGEPRLVGISLAAASTFVLGGLSVQHAALLKRQMRFSAMAMIQLISMAAGLIVGVLLALNGAGYWSLVAIPATSAFITMVLSWYHSGWIPSAPRQGCNTRPLLAFGGFLSGTTFLTYTRRNIDNVLIGSVWGADAVGLYFKAYQLLLLPIQQVNGPAAGVVVPTLSRLQNEPDRYRKYYCTAMLVVTTVTMPTLIFCGVMAEEIILFALGSQWIVATPIFIALLPAALAGTINIAGGWVYVSMGHTNRQFQAHIFATALVVAGIVVGLPWGTIGVAIGFSITFTFSLPLIIAHAFKTSPLRILDLVHAIWNPACASLLAGLTVLIVKLTFAKDFIGWATLPAALILFSVVYVLAWWLLPGNIYRTQMLQVIKKSIFK